MQSEANEKAVFYVSPEGNDAWSGLLPEPNAHATDGPFATLPAAQTATRQARQENAERAVEVFLRGGFYELEHSLNFTSEDTGPQLKPSQTPVAIPVTWKASPGEKPVVSGGRRITGFTAGKLNGKTVWTADVPKVKTEGWYFRQLWVNGSRRLRPVLPREGEYQVETVLDANYEGTHGQTIRKGATRFGFAEGDFDANWRNLQDVEVAVTTLWMGARMNVASVDMKERIVTLDRNSGVRLTRDHTRDGADYTIENVFEALQQPGQWYLDRAECKLYYIPLEGEIIDTAEIVAPRLSRILEIQGTGNRKAGGIRFEGITFAHSEWTPPADSSVCNQAAIDVPGAVQLSDAYYCDFIDCNFVHLGSYAIQLERETNDIAIRACTITDLAAGGVKIWHDCRKNIVADCEISDGGHTYPAAVGVLIGQASGNQVIHNNIHDFYYTGVSVGWRWGYAEGNAYGNVIEYNHIHNLGKRKLSDMGGIYCLGVQPGTRLRYNLIHDITSRTYGGWALYTDEGSSYILLENNVCYDTDRQGFHQHYGRENIIRNNIFAFGAESQMAYTRVEPHVGFTFERNIVVSNGKPMWQNDYRAGSRQIITDNNLYWDVASPQPVMNVYRDETGEVRLTIKQWQALGYDTNSIIADPRFADLSARDFTLSPDSPAFKVGFLPIDMTKVEPRVGKKD